ncbi:hypothetical protein TNCV_4965321 [Trichonephila clavipes]|nr:hypothetical protein TNCV_4965321 [Trichonephila clavipes]
MARLLGNWSCLELRNVIRTLWPKNMSASNINSQIVEVYDEESKQTVVVSNPRLSSNARQPPYIQKHQESIRTEEGLEGPRPFGNPSNSRCGQERRARSNTSGTLEISSDPVEKRELLYGLL